MPRFPAIPMIARFSAYGFLKNQQYYEPFLILAFREKGLSFLMIGMLIGWRELCVNLLEIPSGAFADLSGRRRSMMLSFAAYIVSFVVFALSNHVGALFAAMACFAVGEAFRTGTHKAMIFTWLKREGREKEKTRVYGYTRSWSKTGSAISALIAAGLVFYTGQYHTIFWFCIVPYAVNIVNFMGYPHYLDGATGGNGHISIRETARLTAHAVRTSISVASLRQLLTESMVFESLYKVSKDYLQPVLKQMALAMPFLATLPLIQAEADPERRSAVLVGIVYAALYFLMSRASRNAYRLSDKLGGEDCAVRWLWMANGMTFVVLLTFLGLDMAGPAILCFVALGLLQNLFRPTQLSRYDTHTPEEMQATVLSVESQSKAALAIVLAPLIGWLVDNQRVVWVDTQVRGFWPVAAAGVILCGLMWFSSLRKPNTNCG